MTYNVSNGTLNPTILASSVAFGLARCLPQYRRKLAPPTDDGLLPTIVTTGRQVVFFTMGLYVLLYQTSVWYTTRGQSNLTKSASRRAHSPVRGHPRGSKVVPLNSWGRVSY